MRRPNVSRRIPPDRSDICARGRVCDNGKPERRIA